MKTTYLDQFTPACYGVVLVNLDHYYIHDLAEAQKRLVIAARIADRLLRCIALED